MNSPPTSPGDTVFISHSTRDRVTAEALKHCLEGKGVRCWKAPEDVAPGADWAGAITNAIENATVMVLVWSSAATASDEVFKELSLAMDEGIAVIPVRIENVPPRAGWK